MWNEKVVVSVTKFSGTTTPDKNGEMSVMLQGIAGRMPNRNVLSGTVASRAGFEVGKTYLVNVREIGYDEDFGLQFNWIKVKELETGKDIAETSHIIGLPTIVTIERPEGFEKIYKRKGDAVEGNITQRIKEGKFKPSYDRSVDHTDAAEILEGTSKTDNALNPSNRK